ncbi:MAG: hypothetical protein HDT08_04070 [Bacteroidales bacterium]|nr:hypothetical protein [Bacteroidales bacterium]
MNNLDQELKAAKAQISGCNTMIAQLQLTLDRVVRERNFYYSEVNKLTEALAKYPGALTALRQQDAKAN